jgi:hypothetical protein
MMSIFLLFAARYGAAGWCNVVLAAIFLPAKTKAALLKARLFEIKNVRARDYWTTMLSDRSHIS